MKTFNGRVEDIMRAGVTSCDGYSFDEIFNMLAELKKVTEKELVYDGVSNTIHEVA